MKVVVDKAPLIVRIYISFARRPLNFLSLHVSVSPSHFTTELPKTAIYVTLEDIYKFLNTFATSSVTFKKRCTECKRRTSLLCCSPEYSKQSLYPNSNRGTTLRAPFRKHRAQLIASTRLKYQQISLPFSAIPQLLLDVVKRLHRSEQ